MQKFIVFSTTLIVALLSVTIVQAACSGSNGRGWASGKGAGKFEMSASDKNCSISFVSFINDSTKTKIPATQVSIATQPKSGKVSLTANGLVYSPNAGFKGKDKFCTKNTTGKMKGKTLSGCITITVK